ncbi:hypothetical protein DM860_008511 [Cuscuta australis]|uniref:Pentatricopeptide repeat-containing protein n=1 Tax=Cuscuta australis TaxID=267555 RepID=A0A328DA56_9ASTE|nr:hypothetical protein DM860_008511 [Cuscuta australis]
MKALKIFGITPGHSQQSKIVYYLSLYGKNDEVDVLVTDMDSSGSGLSYKAWASLVDGYCKVDNFSKASDVHERMITKEGLSHAKRKQESSVSAYCPKS